MNYPFDQVDSNDRIRILFGCGLKDGSYVYEVTGYLENAQPSNPTPEENQANGRPADAKPTEAPVGVIETGSFRVVNGVVVTGDGSEEE